MKVDEEEEEEEEEDDEDTDETENESYDEAEDDDEYAFPDVSDDELDDEETIEEEEKANACVKYTAADELAALEADNQMSLEELLSSVNKNVDQIAADVNETLSNKPSSEQTAKTSESAGPQDDKVLTTIAATAQSLQPTGYTLETTKVKTIIPSLLLKHTLREYQHVGLDWLVTMYENKLNGILADEMGLGKTIQTIALLAHLACEKGIWGPHLIVVPTSVMLNWELEFKKWCPGFKILTYYGSPKERRLKRQVNMP